MNIIQTVSMAFKAILSNKTRTILTMLGVIIGVASVIVLVSVFGAVTNQFTSFFTKDQVDISYMGKATGFKDEFDKFYESRLKSLSIAYTPYYKSYQTTPYYSGKTTSGTQAIYTDSTYTTYVNANISVGRNFGAGDIKSRTKVVIIGSYIKKQFFSGLTNPVGQKLKIAGQEYTVIGVLEERFGNVEYTEDNAILLPYSTLMFNRLENAKEIKNFYITANDSESTTQVVDIINNEFKNVFKDSKNVSAYTDNQYLEQMQQQRKTMSLAVGAIGGISLIVGGIGIMNIMLVSVTERTREIGIRMAIGAQKRNILAQFLIEASVVSGFGGILGILFGGFLTVVIGSFVLDGAIVYPSLAIVIGSFLFSVALGLVFGISPANKAANLNPIDALTTK